jgi:DNA helicase HerA-like ATPase
MTPAVTRDAVATDPRLRAFLDPAGPEVFSGIVHGNQIWTPDPFDVETIHAEAREAFARLVNRAAAIPPPSHGKTLLLLGEAGSGKTHLMRAFRNRAHVDGTGYCGYLQMTTRADNYARYTLAKLLDGLEQPYRPGEPSGLTRLARGLLEAVDIIPKPDRDRFAADLELQPADLAPMVERFADAAVQMERFQGVDLDLIRALLWLLPNDARLRPRVLKWLRCEDLNRYDRDMLGGLVPRPFDESPLATMIGLGRLMAAVHGAAVVVLVDQIEEVIELSAGEADRGQVFRRAIDTLVDLMDKVPNSVVVIACLEDYYQGGTHMLTMPKRDRLERDPEPMRLSSRRSLCEVEALTARRLEHLFEELGVAAEATAPTFPFTADHLRPLTALRTRDILDFLRRHHEDCIRKGEWFAPAGVAPPPPAPPADLRWEQLWNDALATHQSPLLDEPALADLLGWALGAVSAEVPEGLYFGVTGDGRFLETDIHLSDGGHDKLLVAVCDRNARGGGLGKQVEEVAKRAGELPAVFVRSTSFPTSPAAEVSKKLTALVAPKGKGRRVVVENGDWRAMHAFRRFHEQHHTAPGFTDWQKEGRPLSRLASVRAVLALDKLLSAQPAPTVSSAPPPPAGGPKPPAQMSVPPAAVTAASDSLLLGHARGVGGASVTLTPQEVTFHMAFLGGSGSGKTTAALALIEQLLIRGVPAVLIDRKGDLCRYADPGAWSSAPGDNRASARVGLRTRVDVALFTPGAPNGRPLAIPVAPADLGQLPAAEREQLAGYTAAALWGMMGFRVKGQDPKLAILAKAIDVLARAPGQVVNLANLRRLIAERDDALLVEVDGFEDKHFRKLAEELQTLSLMRQRLFEGGEALDMDALLGRGPHARPGKTRLSVISTQFLGDAAAADFWVAQLLVALGRWAAKNPNPSGRLQAVFLFDEADQYLPATRQPATKAPLEHLLRRVRSAGVGLLLATQSPGDLDYKCRDQIRTWLVGRVKEQVAINKLRPMLEAGRVDAAAKLPGQGAGQFYLIREQEVLAIQTEQCLLATAQVPEERILELARLTTA